MQTTTKRNAALARIHMVHKSLGLSPEDAVSLKLHVTGKASAADMNDVQRQMYLAHLAGLQERAALARGEKPAYTPKRNRVQRNVDDDQDERWHKARALWAALGAAGVVHTDTDAALMAYVKRQTHMEHWRFLNTAQINTVIEALKKWCRRANVPMQENGNG